MPGTAPTVLAAVQPRPAALTSLRRSAAEMGSLVRLSSPFLATCSLRAAGQGASEFFSLVRCMALSAMLTKGAVALAARWELWRVGSVLEERGRRPPRHGEGGRGWGVGRVFPIQDAVSRVPSWHGRGVWGGWWSSGRSGEWGELKLCKSGSNVEEEDW